MSAIPHYLQFSCTGIDYTGAAHCRNIYYDNVMNERDPFKFYITIDTCPSNRRMILDVVPDGAAETFNNSLKKFISRGGCLARILSGNGGVFVADITQKFVSFRNLRWPFSLKRAPWYGGFWERLVEQLKRCSKKRNRWNLFKFLLTANSYKRN